MFFNKTFCLSAIALSCFACANKSLEGNNIRQRLDELYQRYQSDSKNLSFMSEYIQIWFEMFNDMGDIYEANGGGGLFHFDLNQNRDGRGNPRVPPFLLTAWNRESFIWVPNDTFYGILLNEDERDEVESCCSACSCYKCFFSCISFGPGGKDDYKGYFMKHYGNAIKNYLFTSLQVRSLKQVADYLQKKWVQPVAELLGEACHLQRVNDIAFEDFLSVVQLYRCYAQMDSDYELSSRDLFTRTTYQKQHAQIDYTSIRDNYHDWLLAIMSVNREEQDPIRVFFYSLLSHYDNDYLTYVDRNSLIDHTILHMQRYSIDFLLLGEKLRAHMIGTQNNETTNPILKLLAIKWKEVHDREEAEAQGQAMRDGAGL